MTNAAGTKPPKTRKPTKPKKYDLFLVNCQGAIYEHVIAGLMEVFGKSKDETVNIFLASRIAPGGHIGRFSKEVMETRRKAMGAFVAKRGSKVGFQYLEESELDKIINPKLDGEDSSGS